jgi:hypothetical protein
MVRLSPIKTEPTLHSDTSISLRGAGVRVVMPQMIDHRCNKANRQCTAVIRHSLKYMTYSIELMELADGFEPTTC